MSTGVLASGACLTVLVANDFDEDKALAVAASVPRTAAAVFWGVRTGLRYKRLQDGVCKLTVCAIEKQIRGFNPLRNRNCSTGQG